MSHFKGIHNTILTCFVFRPQISFGSVYHNTMDEISDESFAHLEKLCEETFNVKPMAETDLLQGVKIPDLNDTLEEIDFILSLGEKLKAEGKLNFSSVESEKEARTESFLSVQMNVCAESSPKSSSEIPKAVKLRISKVISPINPRNDPRSSHIKCRSNLNNKVSSYLYRKF